MTGPIGSYALLPWLRQGLSRSITAADGDTSVKFRPTVRVDLTVNGTALNGAPLPGKPVGRDVELYGPGEVIGIEQRAIVRTEPHPWITDFEPNYLAHVEFYDEDFPWRYSPTAPDGLRLRPWIALVVLEDTGDPATTEFTDRAVITGRPLPFIAVADYAAFPVPGELWAWAHVHANRHLGATPDELVAADVPAAVGRLESNLATNPDIAYSRLLCPRRLKENAAYHAFLVPSFERGRLAGLGMDPDTAPFASASAWTDYPGRPEPLSVPYYHRWYFRTGGVGDFESLVRLLTWDTADERIGHRDMDVQAPGSNIPGILDADLHGVLRLGGALRAPVSTLAPESKAQFERYENWAKAAYPHPFQRKLADFVNLADTFTRTPAEQARTDAGLPPVDPDDVDPLITPPIYGEWHAVAHRLLSDRAGQPLDPDDNWVHELNLDPRHRVAAGFGGDVVRKHQESYMEAAWAQIGDVLAHNQKVRVAKTWLAVSEAVHRKALAPLTAEPSRLLGLTAPVQARVLSGEVTVRHARQQSRTPPVLTSSAMRRAARPAGPLSRRLDLPAGPHHGRVLEAVNAGEITAAAPKQAPAGVATVEDVAATVAKDRVWPPEWLVHLARRAPWLKWVLAVLAALAVVLAFVTVFAVIAAVLLALAGVALHLAGREPAVSEALGAELDQPASVERLGTDPEFAFGQPEGTAPRRPFAADNPAAARFKAALTDWTQFAAAAELAGRAPVRRTLDLGKVAGTVADALRPARTIPRRLLATAQLAPHIRDQIVEPFDEVRYYPRIDEPMYQPLKGLSDEHFVPNLNRIPPNSIVALETNQDFIEAYLVGVNHEFSRELLWREYPSDLRGSYFRQFWDVTGHHDPDVTDPDVLREKLYDIPPIHTWRRRSQLGEHDNRQTDSGQEREEIVLVIRGELLKKYPNTVVYAHQAAWAMTNGQIDPSKERTLAELTDAELVKPPTAKVLTPRFEAKVDPDIYFFGFDLTAEEARGGPGEQDTDPPGWFFVLKERPGEPRFGLDVTRPSGQQIVTANDVAWTDSGVAEGGHLAANTLASITLNPPSPANDDMEKKPQHDDDVKVLPQPASAARWAYLLYQAPVMVAVHAAELLKERTTL